MEVIGENFEVNDNNEELSFFQETDDIDFLRNLKEISQKFLEVNDFNLGKEKKVADMTEEKFVEYIEKQNSQKNEILGFFRTSKIEINTRSVMSQIYSHKKNPDYKIFVYFIPTNKNTLSVGVEAVKQLIHLILRMGCTESLVISELKPAGHAFKQMKDIKNTSGDFDQGVYDITFYHDKNFVNIVDHVWSPEVLYVYRTPEEIEKFVLDNKVDISKFPRVIEDNALAKFYRAKTGNIMKIKRTLLYDRTLLDDEITYRIVINSID